jgi:hypothetical protein
VTDEHLSLDELAELDEGLLDPDRTTAARAHLDGCAQCRAQAESITSTRGLLGGLPAEPMPDDVKARLDQALADAAPKPSTVVPQLDEHRKRRFSRPTWAASAAAAAIVLLFGALIVGHLGKGTSSGSGSGASSTAAGPLATTPQPKDYVKTSTGVNYTPTLLISDVPSLVPPTQGASGTTAQAPEASSTAPAPDTETNGSRSRVLASGPVPLTLRPLYNSRAKILQCAAVLSGVPNAVPLAVDFGRWTYESFRRSPAAVFVFKDPDPSVVDVYVTGPACNGDSVRTYVRVPVK